MLLLVFTKVGYVMFHTASYLSMGTSRYVKINLLILMLMKIMEEAKNNLTLEDNEIMDIFSKAKDVFIPGTLD